MKTQPYTLDKWDVRLIQMLKNERLPTFLELRELWAERCALELRFSQLAYVVEHMAMLVDTFNPRPTSSLIYNTQPSRLWQYGAENVTDHWEIWAIVLGHHLRMTEVAKLPGYREGGK